MPAPGLGPRRAVLASAGHAGLLALLTGCTPRAGNAALGDLGRLAWRVRPAWNAGRPGSSAGARSCGDAGDCVPAIRSIGGTPGDDDILAGDAAALVHYFTDDGGQNGGPVGHWITGNEPDNGGDEVWQTAPGMEPGVRRPSCAPAADLQTFVH